MVNVDSVYIGYENYIASNSYNSGSSESNTAMNATGNPIAILIFCLLYYLLDKLKKEDN